MTIVGVENVTLSGFIETCFRSCIELHLMFKVKEARPLSDIEFGKSFI